MSYNSHIDRKYGYFFKPILSGAVFCFVSALIIFSYVGTAEAGLISFIFGGKQVSAKVGQNITENNLQNGLVLVAANNINPNPNKSVEIIPVVGGETLVADLASSNEDSNFSTQISTYIVRQGDTISGVAKMFNVSINTILWANDLTSKAVLKVGQTLVILPVTGISYTVQKNDTVSGIAKKYNADSSDIYNYNDISPSSSLTVGQKLIIPDAEMSVTTTINPSRGAIKTAPYEPLLVNTQSLPSYPGYYSCPVIGRLTQGLHGRNAIDIAASIGTPLHASAAGTVIIAKSNGAWNGGYGNFVVISHDNGTQTLYAHMSRSAVSVGDYVSKGQIIGYIGMTGLTTGPHIHFEIRGAQNPFAVGGCN